MNKIVVCFVLYFDFFFQSVSFNSEMTEFSITSHNITEVERLLHEVSYINSRRFPTPGRRNIDMRTAIM